MANGPIGMPNLVTTASTCCGSAPSNNSFSACLPRCASMRLPTKQSQTPTTAGTWRSCVPPPPRHQRIRRGLFGAHDFAQLHHVGRAEEVHAEHVLRPLGHRGDLVDVEIRGVAGQHGAGFCIGVERGEDFLLQPPWSRTPPR